MKTTLMIVLLSLGLGFGASAQRFGHGGGFGGGRYYGGGFYPRTYVGVGIGLGYPYGYGWYGPYGPYGPYPPYYYGYGAMPNQLELQVRDIKADYEARIKDVKNDKALSHRERRDKINGLKTERDNAIVQARHDYFYHAQRNYNNGQYNNGQQQQNQPQQNQQQQQPQNGNNNGSSSDGPEYQQGSNSASGSK